MLYNNRYEVNVKIGDADLTQEPSNYSFSIFDSIYNLYPQAKFIFNDQTGQFNEFMGLIDGIKVELTLGAKDNSFSCPFVVVQNANPEQMTQSVPSGNIETKLVHEYAYKQKLSSKAYNDEISNIIRSVVNKYEGWPKKGDLNTFLKTQTKGIYYQPLIPDDKFILEHLLPFAYTSDNENSPFYAFIDCHGNFNFTSYKHLINQKEIGTFTLSGRGIPSELNNKTIMNFYPIQTNIKDIYPMLHRLFFNFLEDNTFNFGDDKINDYFVQSNSPIAIKRDLTGLTSYTELLDDDVVLPETLNHNYGQLLFGMRGSFSIDKAVIIMPLSPDVKAGAVIDLNLPSGTDDKRKENSVRFSGKYLIEASYQKWSGRQGMTVAIISRKPAYIGATFTRAKEIIPGVTSFNYVTNTGEGV